MKNKLYNCKSRDLSSGIVEPLILHLVCKDYCWFYLYAVFTFAFSDLYEMYTKRDQTQDNIKALNYMRLLNTDEKKTIEQVRQ